MYLLTLFSRCLNGIRTRRMRLKNNDFANRTFKNVGLCIRRVGGLGVVVEYTHSLASSHVFGRARAAQKLARRLLLKQSTWIFNY